MEAPSPGAAVSGAGAKAVEAVRARVCPRGLSPAGRGAPGRQGLCGLPPSAPLPLSLVGNRAPRWPTTATGDGRPSVPPAAAVRRLCCRPWRRRGTRARSRHLHCPRKPGRGQPAPGRRLARCGPLAGPPRWGAAPRPTGGAARGGRGAGAPAWDARGGEKALFWPPRGARRPVPCPGGAGARHSPGSCRHSRRRRCRTQREGSGSHPESRQCRTRRGRPGCGGCSATVRRDGPRVQNLPRFTPVTHAPAGRPPSSPPRPLSTPRALSWKQHPGASPPGGNQRPGRPGVSKVTARPAPSSPAWPCLALPMRAGPGPRVDGANIACPAQGQAARQRGEGLAQHGGPRAGRPRGHLDQALQRPPGVADAPLPVLAAGSPRHGFELRGAVPVVPLLNAPAPASWSDRAAVRGPATACCLLAWGRVLRRAAPRPPRPRAGRPHLSPAGSCAACR